MLDSIGAGAEFSVAGLTLKLAGVSSDFFWMFELYLKKDFGMEMGRIRPNGTLDIMILMDSI